MFISKRFLTFVFTTITAFSFFAVSDLVAQQRYSGLDMPQGFYVPPKPKDSASREVKQAWQRGTSPARKRISSNNAKVRAVLAAGGDVKTDADARKYLEVVVFPAMTQTNSETLSSLGVRRQDFLKDFLNKDVTGVARARMIDFTVETLQGYCINTTLHPSARVNAVVLMSQLTDRPLINRIQAPTASGKAFVVLQKIFNGENEKQFPEYLKIAAFSGMKNQLEMNAKSGQAVNANLKAQLVESLMKMLPAEVDSETDAAGYWKKRQAVQMAAVLRDAKTLPPLMAILSDDVSSFELKLDVVKTITQAGAMGADAKTSGTVLAAVCKFAGMAVAGEATNIAQARQKMIRDGILFGDVDLMQSTDPIDFQPAAEDGSGNRDFDIDGKNRLATPLIELPNYQLNNSRNRIRAVSLFCPQAIERLRKGVDAKAEALARGTVGELKSLLARSSVGQVDIEKRVRDEELTPEEVDRARKISYVDQMIKVCEDSGKVLAQQFENYSAQ